METDSWQQADWIRLNFSGIVENEHDVRLLEERFQQAYGERVRRLDIDRDRVAVLPGIASQPLAAAFLKSWQEKEPAAKSQYGGTDHARQVWLRARELGLKELKKVLEAGD